MTFAEVLEAAVEEPIQFAAIGAFGWDGYNQEFYPGTAIPEDQLGKVMPWAEARELLSYEYKADWGAPKCHAVFAWTDNHTMWMRDYDGMTSVHVMLGRAPEVGTALMPQFS